MRALLFRGLLLAVAAAHLALIEAASWRAPPATVAHGAHGDAARRVTWLAPPSTQSRAATAHGASPPVRSAAAPSLRPAAPVRSTAAPSPRPAPRAPPISPAPPAPPAPSSRPTGAGAKSSAPGWPVYATRPPPEIRLAYALRQTNPGGPAPEGDAELDWTRPGPGYALRLATRLGACAPREWLGDGGFDAAGLAPRHLEQRDRGRATRRVEFDRTAARVRFQGPGAPSSAFAPGAQDRWSWIAQLAAIAEADPRQLAVAHLQVAGLRGQLERWSFRAQSDPGLPTDALDLVAAPWRAGPLLHLLREPERPYDLRVEAWLSPALHHFPVALRLSTPPGAWTFDLQLVSADDATPAGP